MNKPERECKCGHSKGGHYNGLGMCRQENGTGHICQCRRYKPVGYPRLRFEMPAKKS